MLLRLMGIVGSFAVAFPLKIATLSTPSLRNPLILGPLPLPPLQALLTDSTSLLSLPNNPRNPRN